jgi:hypothetical protein
MVLALILIGLMNSTLAVFMRGSAINMRQPVRVMAFLNRRWLKILLSVNNSTLFQLSQGNCPGFFIFQAMIHNLLQFCDRIQNLLRHPPITISHRNLWETISWKMY